MSENNMNAAQVQLMQQKMQAALQQAIENMQLRKWAMEQALAIFTASMDSDVVRFVDPGTDPTVSTALTILAAEIYAFVAKPAIEFKVEDSK